MLSIKMIKTHLPAETQSHFYEEVKDLALYQDVPFSPLPPPPSLLDQGLPHQRTEWKSSAFPPVCEQPLHMI